MIGHRFDNLLFSHNVRNTSMSCKIYAQQDKHSADHSHACILIMSRDTAALMPSGKEVDQRQTVKSDGIQHLFIAIEKGMWYVKKTNVQKISPSVLFNFIKLQSYS